MKLISLLYSLGAHIGHNKRFLKHSNISFIQGDINRHNLINIQHTVFFLKKTCSFFFHAGTASLHLCFHISDLYKYNWSIKSYLIHQVVFVNKHSLLFERWKNGCFSNYKTQVSDVLEAMTVSSSKKSKDLVRTLISPKNYKVLYSNSNKSKLSSKSFMHWIDLLLQILFFVKTKQVKGLKWEQEWNRISRFWRFYHYFKCYFYFLNWPDCFVLVNNQTKDAIISEVNRKKIPIVGLIDTNSSNKGYTYYIPSNDDSLLLNLFYFRLFLSSYQRGSTLYFK